MTRTRAVALLAAAAALGGCFDMTSEVAVITEASRAAQLPLQPGRYCDVGVTLDDADAPATTIDDDCFDVAVDGGTLIATGDDPSEGTLVLEVASLGRGASLLQFYNSDLEKQSLLYAFISADGVAILEEPPATQLIVDAAERAGVTLVYSGEEAVGEEIEIVSGEPDAILGFLRDASGLMFDDALRDPQLAYDLKDEAAIYIRVGDGAEDADLDEAAALDKVMALFAMIDRAMTLE